MGTGTLGFATLFVKGLNDAPNITLAASLTVDVANLFSSACVALRQNRSTYKALM
jgi:hypothetical protein